MIHKNELWQYFVEECRSVAWIAKKCGVSRETVYNWLKKYDIKRKCQMEDCDER